MSSSPPETPERDPGVAALLQQHLAAPPLRPGFHDQLEVRLAEADATAAGAPDAGRRRRLTVRRVVPVAAAAAALALFVFVALPALRGGSTATAADVLSAMSAGPAGATTVRLHVAESFSVVREGDSSGEPQLGGESTAVVTLDVGGDSLTVRESSMRGGEAPEGGTWNQMLDSVVSYDQSRHVLRSVDEFDGTAGASITAFVVKPSWGSASSADQVGGVSYETLAACVRAQLAEADPEMPVEETTYLGRPVWRAELVEDEWWGLDGDLHVIQNWDVTVDQATGLLMTAGYAFSTDPGEEAMSMAMDVTKLELDPELAPGWQRAELPDEGRIRVIDEGTRFGTPDEVAERSWPTLPLIPQWAPPGYRLTEVASAGAAGASGYSIASWEWTSGGDAVTVERKGRFVHQRIPWSMPDQTVLVRFRRGFSSFTVEVGPKRFGESLGPVAGPGVVPEGASGHDAVDVKLSGGFLEGAEARTWVALDQYEGPRLLTYSDRSRIWIRGDLTREELIEVANSLKVYGDTEKSIMPGY
jgi:hypothetical protein